MAPIVPGDLEQALSAQERGETTLDAVEYGREGPFVRLRAHPVEAVQTWRDMFEVAGFHKRSKLMWLLEDLCIPESTDVLTDLASESLPPRTPQAGHHMQTPRMRAEMIQAQAFRALGKVSGSGCDSLEAPTATRSADAVTTLEAWVFDSSVHHSQRRLAGEALLTDHAARAATLRTSLPADEQWMLTPFDERRVEMVVEDTPPDRVPKSQRVEASDTENSSEEETTGTGTTWAISSLCRITVLVGWPSNGDDFVSQWIALWAWFTGEGCTQLRSRYDSDVNFQNNTWDEEFGYYYECSDNRPFKRMINALFILEHASSTPNPTGDYSGGVIHWAWDYIKRETPEFEGSCSTNGAGYYSAGWWPWGDEYIALRLPLWPHSVVVRSSIILHEARHAGGYSHNASDSSCPAGGSCDSHYGYHGANTIEVQWLAQYYRGGNIADAYLRGRAWLYANLILETGYAQCPNVLLDPNGWFYSVPDACDE